MRYHHEKLGLYYEKTTEGIVILEGERMLEAVIIPQMIEELEVIKINKKAFMGCKILKSIYLPDGICEIGDFAFALCDHLREISIPCKEMKLGQSLFKNDGELTSVLVRREDIDEKTKRDAAFLMGMATLKMKADYLIDIGRFAGDEWFKSFDQKLLDILSSDEADNYQEYVLCGEEDLLFDFEQYVNHIKEERSGLCIHRLMHDEKLSQTNRQKFMDYLIEMSREDTNSGECPPVFGYLLKEHGDDNAYFELLKDIGVIDKKNREDLMNRMKDRHPQTKAYLINAFLDEEEPAGGFFDDLLL